MRDEKLRDNFCVGTRVKAKINDEKLGWIDVEGTVVRPTQGFAVEFVDDNDKRWFAHPEHCKTA